MIAQRVTASAGSGAWVYRNKLGLCFVTGLDWPAFVALTRVLESRSATSDEWVEQALASQASGVAVTDGGSLKVVGQIEAEIFESGMATAGSQGVALLGGSETRTISISNDAIVRLRPLMDEMVAGEIVLGSVETAGVIIEFAPEITGESQAVSPEKDVESEPSVEFVHIENLSPPVTMIDLTRTGENVALATHVGTEPLHIVRGVLCPNQHINDFKAAQCWSCGCTVQNNSVEGDGERPQLGTIWFDDGPVLSLERDLIVGRDPGPADAQLHTVAFPDEPHISRRHLRIQLDDWNVRVSDLDSSNGTWARFGKTGPRYRLEPNKEYQLDHYAELWLFEKKMTFQSIYHESSLRSS